MFSRWKMVPVKQKNKTQRIKKFFLGSVKELDIKVFISFAKDKTTINAVRIFKFNGLKPSLIRKWCEQVNNINRTREPARIGLDLKMFTFSNISLSR